MLELYLARLEGRSMSAEALVARAAGRGCEGRAALARLCARGILLRTGRDRAGIELAPAAAARMADLFSDMPTAPPGG